MRMSILIVLISLLIFITGCGSNGGNQSHNPITPNVISSNNISLNLYQVRTQGVADTSTADEKKKHFDDELSKSGDEASMEQVIRDFCNYGFSRDSKNKVTISDANIKKLAKKELASKKNPTISPAKLTKILEKRSEELGAQDSKLSQEIEMVQNIVRTDLPHIAANPSNKNMTPFEALVITYGIFTADDGHASPKTLNVSNISQEKLDIFVKDLIEDKED